MKFISSEEEQKEQRVKLFFKKESDVGGVVLYAEDDSGREWTLMIFRDGKFKRIAMVSAGLGITVDEKGRIVEE